jgi:signal transduction histidine kinase
MPDAAAPPPDLPFPLRDFAVLRVARDGRLLWATAEAIAMLGGAMPSDLAHTLSLSETESAALTATTGPWSGEASLYRGEATPVQVSLTAWPDGEAVLVILRLALGPLVRMQEEVGAINSALTNLNRERAKQNVQLTRALQQLEARQAEVAEKNAALVALNAALDEANQQLRALDEVKSRFYANMSHELRTPLSSIIGFAEDALDGLAGELNDELRLYFTTIHQSGRRQFDLISDVLDFAKLQSGRTQLHPEAVDLARLADELAKTMRPLMQRKRQTFTLAIPPDLPRAHADADRTFQVLLNLVSNAHKYTPEGGRIHLAAESKGDCIRVTVSDTGVGIPGEDLPHIFEEFYQVRQHRPLRRQTTGLGLAITKHLVEVQGGTIAARSTPGEGTAVSFTLPLAPGETP